MVKIAAHFRRQGVHRPAHRIGEKPPSPYRAEDGLDFPTRGSQGRCFAVSCCRSRGAQIARRGLTGSAVGDEIESDLLPFVEPGHPSALDRADVDEYVVAAVIRLDESKALLAVEPLHSSFNHIASSFRDLAAGNRKIEHSHGTNNQPMCLFGFRRTAGINLADIRQFLEWGDAVRASGFAFSSGGAPLLRPPEPTALLAPIITAEWPVVTASVCLMKQATPDGPCRRPKRGIQTGAQIERLVGVKGCARLSELAHGRTWRLEARL
jgi:hypothetical protein